MSSPPGSAAVSAPPSRIDGVTELLACRTAADRVGEVLHRQATAAIVEAVRTALPADIGPVRCSITRSKLKPGRRLTVSAEISVPGGTSAMGSTPRPVTAIWGEPTTPFVGWADDPAVPVEVRHPFSALRVTPGAPSDGTPFLLIAPLDPAFPALAAVHDRDHMARLLRSHGIEVGPGEPSVTTLRYRPGQRHVLRLDLASGRRVFVKCYRDGTGERAAEAWRALADALSAWGGPAVPVRPLAYVPTERLMLWEGVEGATLGDVLDTSLEPVRAAGAALRAIHDRPVDAAHPAPVSDPAREGTASLRSAEHVAALLPAAGERMAALVAEAVRRLGETPAESGHLLHGDYKCDNLVVEGDRLRLLDLDRVTVGDPALDLGKISADLRWWAASRRTDAQPLLAALLDGYGACPDRRLRRAALYDVLFTVRSIGRRIALHEPGWAARVERMLEDTNRDSNLRGMLR